MNRVLSVLLIIALMGCRNTHDFIILEKDLIPEGTAIDSRNETVLIGSIYKQKIVGIGPNGEVFDVISSDQFNFLSPLGMEMENSTQILWVNAVQAPIVPNVESSETAAVLGFDLKTKRLIKRINSPVAGVLLNDLTLDNSGNIYVTETIGGIIYIGHESVDKLTEFHSLDKFTAPNGIVYYAPGHCLFVATNEGIVKIDLQTKQARLMITAQNIDTKVIDGLSIYQQSLIGHQSTKVMRFYFDDQLSKITKAEVLSTGPEFDSSTTGEINKNEYFFIVNSQLRSGVDRVTKKIKPLDSLENIIVRKIKL